MERESGERRYALRAGRRTDHSAHHRQNLTKAADRREDGAGTRHGGKRRQGYVALMSVAASDKVDATRGSHGASMEGWDLAPGSGIPFRLGPDGTITVGCLRSDDSVLDKVLVADELHRKTISLGQATTRVDCGNCVFPSSCANLLGRGSTLPLNLRCGSHVSASN